VTGDDARQAPEADDPRWSLLGDAALWARVIRVQREDIAYFKHLFESYEGVAIVRTVETRGDGTVAIAVLATADFRDETDAILSDVAARGAPGFLPAPLPPVCTEDWFLHAWTREQSDD